MKTFTFFGVGLRLFLLELTLILFVGALGFIGLEAPWAQARPGFQANILQNPHPVVHDGFSLSLAVKGHHVLVGAPHAVSQEGETGRAFLFDWTTGKIVQKFSPTSPVGDDVFGLSVGFLNDLAVVGAPQGKGRFGINSGAVYLFDPESGEHIRTLHSPSQHAQIFGHAVAGQGDWLVIGDPGASTGATFHVGAAYVFQASTGKLLHTLLSPDPKKGDADRFGHAITFVGSLVAIAAPGGGSNPIDRGVVYVFDPATGKLVFKLQSPSPQAHEYFGWSLVGDGTHILIGAVGSEQVNSKGGAAFVFDSKGQFQTQLVQPHAKLGEFFGEAVTMGESHFIVAAPGHDSDNTVDRGAVYVFDRKSGSIRNQISNPAKASQVSRFFGQSLILAGDHLLVGTPASGIGAVPDSGVVQILPLP
jgi:outer membrane protein assembly factor BamB